MGADDAELTSRTRLRWHLLALIVLLVALWPLLDLDGVFTTDEGAYAVQARALEQGSWDVGYAFGAADPEHRFIPYQGVSGSEGQVYTYISHPLWPRLLATSSSVFGEDIGFRAPGLVSVIALALSTWGIATEIGRPERAPWAFWAAVASPALAHGWILWAHAPSAACGGALVYFVLRARRSSPWLVGVAAAAALGVLFRAEGLLWAGAVALGAGLAAGRRRDPRQAAAALLALLASAVALLLERQWSHALGGDAAPTALSARDGGSDMWERVRGARIALLDGAVASDVGQMLSLFSVVAVVMAALAVRRRPELPQLFVAALFASGIMLFVRGLVASDDPATGLLAAAPVLLLASAWRPNERGSGLFLGSAVLVYTGAVVATQYADGGSFQWGGRFFAPAIGVLAALAMTAVPAQSPVAVASSATRRRSPWMWASTLALGLLLIVQGALATIVPDRVRRANEQAITAVTSLGPSAFLAGNQQIARLDWRGWPGRCWMAVTEPDELADAFAVLIASGVDRAVFAGIDADRVRSLGFAIDAASTRVVGVADLQGGVIGRHLDPRSSCAG